MCFAGILERRTWVDWRAASPEELHSASAACGEFARGRKPPRRNFTAEDSASDLQASRAEGGEAGLSKEGQISDDSRGETKTIMSIVSFIGHHLDRTRPFSAFVCDSYQWSPVLTA